MLSKPRFTIWKILVRSLIAFGSALALIIIFLIMYFNLAPQIGGKSQGERLQRMRASPNFKDGKFQNPIQTDMNMPIGAGFGILGLSSWRKQPGAFFNIPGD